MVGRRRGWPPWPPPPHLNPPLGCNISKFLPALHLMSQGDEHIPDSLPLPYSRAGVGHWSELTQLPALFRTILGGQKHPLTHCCVQNGLGLSQVGGQALPQSLNSFPPVHSSIETTTIHDMWSRQCNGIHSSNVRYSSQSCTEWASHTQMAGGAFKYNHHPMNVMWRATPTCMSCIRSMCGAIYIRGLYNTLGDFSCGQRV